MRYPSIIEIASLYEAFRKIPVGSNLLHYLSQPKTSKSPDEDRLFAEKFYACLYERVADVSSYLLLKYGSGDLSYVPQDAGVVKKKLSVMCNNNRAYELAVKTWPTRFDLEEFSRLDPCWSLLFSVKLYLHHHEHHAMEYRGMLPFGGGVIESINRIWGRNAKARPTHQDHVRLMNMTNELADKLGMTTIAVNDMLYLEGMKLRQGISDDNE